MARCDTDGDCRGAGRRGDTPLLTASPKRVSPPPMISARVLLAAGARVRGYDPAAMDRMQALHPELEYSKDAYALAAGADALIVVTEWNEFRHLDLARIKSSMRKPVVIDGRNIYVPATMRGLGFTYRGIGRD